jgi:hypothetical protein
LKNKLPILNDYDVVMIEEEKKRTNVDVTDEDRWNVEDIPDDVIKTSKKQTKK